MGSIQEHDYVKVCAQLATSLSISISAAKKKIDLVAARQGKRDLSERKAIALQLLAEANKISSSDQSATTAKLDHLLKALAEEENFMVED